MKKKIWGVLLSVAVLVTTVNFPTTAGAEENKGGADASGIVVKVSDDMNGSNANESDEIQTVQISAQNQSNMDAVVRIFLLNEDKETADTEVEIPNLCDKDQITDETVQTEMAETLKSALTLESGTNSALDAQWIEKKDDSGNVTAKYLEAALPAGAATAFDMKLMYRTDEENYTKKTIVQAKAFVEDQDVTQASDQEDEDNETEVVWEVVKMEEESEAEEESEKSEGTAGEEVKANRTAEKSASGEVSTQAEETESEESTISSVHTVRSADYTVEQIKAIRKFMEEHPEYFLLDTTGMSNESADWTGTIYFNLTNDSADNFIANAGRIEGTGIAYWDLTNYKDTDELVLLSVNNWSTANSSDYNKTNTYVVSNLKGKLYQQTGTFVSDSGGDEGRTYYTIAEVIFEQSSLSAKTVYFDNTNVQNISEPYIKITDGAGETQIIKMELCYNQENIYSYQFADYVLPGTSFQFTDAEGNNAIPTPAVTTVSTKTPCYNGTEWVEYKPEASTVRIYVKHMFIDKGGAVVVFTKDGQDTGKTIEIGTANGTFTFDFAEDTYNGFYIRQKDNGETGNTTEIKEENEIREAVNTYGFYIMATVGDWINTNTKRTLTFGEYSSLADSSLNIPKGTFQKDPEIYYVQSTFYDYYSDEELKGNNRKNLSGNFDHTNGSADKIQARTFDSAISNYFAGTSLASGTNQSPLYFGEFTQATTNWLTNFVWQNNNGEPNRVGGLAGARQGLVNSELVDDQLVMGTENIVAPFFSKSFLRGNNSTNSELGYVFPDVQFPFVKNEEGYWEFDSYNSDQTLRMKQDDSGAYFLDRVGAENEVKGYTSIAATEKSNFFPFNDHAESENPKKLNYAFGLRLDIPFYMTSDGTVKVTDSSGQTKSENIVFNFSGDDDVWVFIDGKLILDIGGQHGAVDGKIDFAKCIATTTTTQDSEKSFDKLSATEEHTLTMFYVERGLWESNMHITFNFPQANSLEVEKEIVIPEEVNSYFEDAMDVLRNSVSFPIEMKNLVTSGESVTIEGEVPAEDKNYDEINSGTRVYLQDPKYSSVCEIGDGANRTEVLEYYYPGEKGASDGQNVTDGRSFYLEKSINIDTEHMKEYGYLQFDAYADTSGQASSPFVALIDSQGHKIGAWISSAVYGGGDNNLGSKTWKTLRVDISKLKLIDSTEFDYSNVVKVQFAYWDDVTIYLDNFRFRAPEQYAPGTGFSKDQAEIPDYGSYKSQELEPVNGAEYTKKGNEGSLFVEGDHIYLKNGEQAIFSDQFRRESYLALTEECNTTVFDTTWSVYENNELQQSGNGVSVDDGRTEPSPENDTGKPDSPTLLFKSFDEELGESLTNYFSLHMKYTNTLKLEDLTITKVLPENQTDSGHKYTFQITFTNIAGMSLEEQLATPLEPMTIEVAAGESKTIEGIPAGTQYVIREVPQEGQEFSLIQIDQIRGNDAYEINLTDNCLTGTVNGDGDDEYRFVNDVNPSVEIRGKKNWQNVPDGVSIISVTLDLERKLQGQDDSKYESAKDVRGKDVEPITITNDTSWEYIFNNVPKYNGTGTDKIEYVYRVVETHVNGVEVEKTPYLPTGGTDDGQGNYNITNTYQKTDLEVLKVNANNTDSPLSDVTFELERLDDEGNVDTSFPLRTITTGEDGKIRFSDLTDGTYRLTETKAKSGYSLLKSPLIVVIDRTNGCTVRSEDQAESEAAMIEVIDNTISIKVSNRPLFELPSTGGYLRAYMIAGGLALAGIALFIYRLQKRRKEVKTPGQRRK